MRAARDNPLTSQLRLKLAVNNRIKDAGGVAQQLEKVGVKQVLRQAIVELGIPFDDLCTDPCRGAPKDIREVLALQIVQKMLHLLPDEVTKWVAERLGVLPAASAGVAPPGGRQLRQWADIVAGLDVVLPTIELSDTQRRGFHHHLDVFHVEVKVYDALKTLVAGATKRVKGDKSAETKKKVGHELPCQHKPLNRLLLELRSRTTLRLEGNEAAQLGDMDTNGWVDVNKKPSVKIKQAILLRHRESEGAPAEATPPDPASRPSACVLPASDGEWPGGAESEAPGRRSGYTDDDVPLPPPLPPPTALHGPSKGRVRCCKHKCAPSAPTPKAN